MGFPFGTSSIAQLENRVTGKDNTENGSIDNNNLDTKHVRSQCQIIVYSWSTRSLKTEGSSAKELSATKKIDVSTRLLYASFNKSLNNISGSFSFSLANNTGDDNNSDWKDLIKPGTWCAIYMSQDGDLELSPNIYDVKKTHPKKLRCVGYIERVSIKSELNEKGAYDAIYEFSGRDFGIIYEETTIWHNMFVFEQTALDSLIGSQLDVVGTKTIDQVLKTVHDLFWSPAKLLPEITSAQGLTSVAKQWLLPTALIRDLNMSLTGESYYGNINDVFKPEPTHANIPVSQPLDYLSGNAWEKLKALSVPALHEFFCETTTKGKFKLIFRPTPWAIDLSKYKRAGSVVCKYKDIKPRVKLSSLDVLTFDIGEDDHNRKNHFLVTVRTTLINAEDNTSTISGSGFPRQNIDSVRRHGFRPMHLDVNSFSMNEMRNDGKADRSKLIEYNEMLYDYWNNAVFFESGSVNIIGRNDIKIGKTLQCDDTVPYIANKIFYIEEYTDEFVVEPSGATSWLQTINMSRGVEESDLDVNSGFSRRKKNIKIAGDFNE